MQPRRLNSLRLAGYDYAEPGFYFLTFVVKPRRPLFGRVLWERGKPETAHVELSPDGKIVAEHWAKVTIIYPELRTDALVIMPDHVHVVLQIVQRFHAKGRMSFLRHGMQPGAIGTVIGSFKGAVTKDIRKAHGAPIRVWHRDFHDHVIRDEGALGRIRTYIQLNPMRGAMRREEAECLAGNRMKP